MVAMHRSGAAIFIAPFAGLWQNAGLQLWAGMARLMLRIFPECVLQMRFIVLIIR
jgi:hypothetical protein